MLASLCLTARRLSTSRVWSGWYLPDEDSKIKPNVFPATSISDKSQVPFVFQNMGVGHVGYTGHVNTEGETTAVVLAMLKLL